MDVRNAQICITDQQHSEITTHYLCAPPDLPSTCLERFLHPKARLCSGTSLGSFLLDPPSGFAVRLELPAQLNRSAIGGDLEWQKTQSVGWRSNPTRQRAKASTGARPIISVPTAASSGST